MYTFLFSWAINMSKYSLIFKIAIFFFLVFLNILKPRGINQKCYDGTFISVWVNFSPFLPHTVLSLVPVVQTFVVFVISEDACLGWLAPEVGLLGGFLLCCCCHFSADTETCKLRYNGSAPTCAKRPLGSEHLYSVHHLTLRQRWSKDSIRGSSAQPHRELNMGADGEFQVVNLRS